MGFASWMLPVLLVLGATFGVEPQGRASGRFSARWVGQDGHDYVGPSDKLGPSDIQDIHIAIAGLDPRREVVFLEVSSTNGTSGGLRRSPPAGVPIEACKRRATGDVFIEPARVETGQPFHVLVRYDDGSTAETDLRGGKADHKLRVTAVALAARWIGQDRQDRTGAGPSVGADGFQDVRIHLSRLVDQIDAERHSHQRARRPELGIGHRTSSCFRVPSWSAIPRIPSQADLFFQPTRDLSGQRLKVTAVYENDQLDSTTIAAGRCDPKLRIPQPPLPKLSELTATGPLAGTGCRQPEPGRATCMSASRGCRLARDRRRRCSATRSGACGSTERTTRAPMPADASAEPFAIKPRADRKIDRRVLPALSRREQEHDDAQADRGRRPQLDRDLPRGSCDPGKRSGAPEPTQSAAKPGDDLQSLVDRFGAVSLSAGTYRLSRPLVLNRPVTLYGSGGATLLVFPAGERVALVVGHQDPLRQYDAFAVSPFGSKARSAGTTTSSMARP